MDLKSSSGLTTALIVLAAITALAVIAEALTSKIESKKRSMHGIQFYIEWTWAIAWIIIGGLIWKAYAHFPGNSHDHDVLVNWTWIGLGLLAVEFVAGQQVRNRHQGKRGKRLPRY